MADTNGAGSRPGRKRATLKTIAELTGLSLRRSPLALRGGGSLKEETSRRVAEAAKELGYVPDRAGVRLRTGKTNVIALILAGDDEAIDFARHMIRGIGTAIAGTRYHLNVMPEFVNSDPIEAVRYVLENRVADGVIPAHTAPQDARAKLMMDQDFPFVTHGRTDFGAAHASHDFHAEAFVDMAVERLAAQGCRSILLDGGVWRDHQLSQPDPQLPKGHRPAGTGGTGGTADGGKPDSAALRAAGLALAKSPDRPDGLIWRQRNPRHPLLGGLAEGGRAAGPQHQGDLQADIGHSAGDLPGRRNDRGGCLCGGYRADAALMLRIARQSPEGLQTLGGPIPHWSDGA